MRPTGRTVVAACLFALAASLRAAAEDSLWSSNPDAAGIGDRNAFGSLRFE